MHRLSTVLLLVFATLTASCRREEQAVQPKGPDLSMIQDVGSLTKNTNSGAGSYSLWIWIPAQVNPMETGSKLEDAVSQLLTEQKLGKDGGGGSMVTPDNQHGYVFTVFVTDVDRAVPLIVSKLKELGAPNGSCIEQNGPEKKTIPIQ